MSITEAEKKQRFQKLCAETDDKVRELHKPSSGGFSLNAMKGWFWNQWNRKTTVDDVAVGAGRIGARAVSYFLGAIPFFGALLTMTYDEAIAFSKRKADEKSLQKGVDSDDLKGTFLVEHGMQAYVDAVRKAHDAETEFVKASVSDCKQFTEMLAKYYYWKYRLERLAYYQAIIEGFQKKVGEALTAAELHRKKVEQELMKNGLKIYEDPRWHASCREVCVYPWEKMEISGPFNVKKVSSMLQPGPNAGQSVRVVPTGKNSLPLPPRPANFPKK